MQEKYDIIGDVRGKGLMIGAEIVKDPKTKESGDNEAHEIMMKSFRRGLAIITAGHSTLRIAPPLIITRDLVDSDLDILEGAIKEGNKTAKDLWAKNRLRVVRSESLPPLFLEWPLDFKLICAHL